MLIPFATRVLQKVWEIEKCVNSITQIHHYHGSLKANPKQRVSLAVQE
jgi:hypothetical protein